MSSTYIILGTSGRYNASKVLRQWKTIVDAAEAESFKIFCFCSDGDSRYMTAQLRLLQRSFESSAQNVEFKVSGWLGVADTARKFTLC